MIEVIFSDETIEIKGHANYADKGHDIVCAGISALHYALTVYLGQIDAYKINIKNLTEKQKGALDSFILGVTAIAESYPLCVKVRDGRAKP